jgi:hypothetical protein
MRVKRLNNVHENAGIPQFDGPNIIATKIEK